MRDWTVVCKPTSFGDTRGLAVFITDGDDEEEVGRVAYVRSKSENPKLEFAEQLDNVLKRADDAAGIVNELAWELERLRADADAERQQRELEAVEDAKAKIREAVNSVRSQTKEAMS